MLQTFTSSKIYTEILIRTATKFSVESRFITKFKPQTFVLFPKPLKCFISNYQQPLHKESTHINDKLNIFPHTRFLFYGH
jgi:hypothetical protein